MNKETELLLQMLDAHLHGRSYEKTPEGIDWSVLTGIALKHGVLPLVYDILAQQENLPDLVRSRIHVVSERTVLQNYHLLYLSARLLKKLEEAQIPAVLLKGMGTASYYPVPELRKSGDVDLLLLEEKALDKALEILREMGCKVKEEQAALHHVELESTDRINIEVHTMLAEPFDNKKINAYLIEQQKLCKENLGKKEVIGETLTILNPGYHGYELLLHMLQHFLRSGFGLKFLCDWVVFWESEVDEKEQETYRKLIRESGLKGFSDMITLCCCQYLGLQEQKIQWMEPDRTYNIESFFCEILEAEEFGKSSGNRMVTLRGVRFRDFCREFHHQMCLNFPKASKCFLIWPVLWCITLVRFLRNNKKIRNQSTWSILKKARSRSKEMEQLHLFETK